MTKTVYNYGFRYYINYVVTVIRIVEEKIFLGEYKLPSVKSLNKLDHMCLHQLIDEIQEEIVKIMYYINIVIAGQIANISKNKTLL